MKDYYWRVATYSGRVIELTVDFLDIESGGGCAKDFLKVFDGLNARATLLKTYCGETPRDVATITSSRNYVYLHFRADGDKDGTRFKVTWKAIISARVSPSVHSSRVTGVNATLTTLILVKASPSSQGSTSFANETTLTSDIRPRDSTVIGTTNSTPAPMRPLWRTSDTIAEGTTTRATAGTMTLARTTTSTTTEEVTIGRTTIGTRKLLKTSPSTTTREETTVATEASFTQIRTTATVREPEGNENDFLT